jgi:hypothetical protein
VPPLLGSERSPVERARTYGLNPIRGLHHENGNSWPFPCARLLLVVARRGSDDRTWEHRRQPRIKRGEPVL